MTLPAKPPTSRAPQGAQPSPRPHVERALYERILRLNFIEEEIRRLIADGTLIVTSTARGSARSTGSPCSTSAATPSAVPRASPRPSRSARRA